jgi:hypothetical protein
MDGGTLKGGCETSITLDQIITDPRAQQRPLSEQWVDKYFERIDESGFGYSFPPIDVFSAERGAGKQYYLADGFHRVAAAVRDAEKSQTPLTAYSILCRTHTGYAGETGLNAAILLSLSANGTHGYPRDDTTEGKTKRVLALLNNPERPEWAELSDRKIADLCEVSHPFVAQVRANPDRTDKRTKAARTKAPTKAVMYVHPTDGPAPGSAGNITASDQPLLRVSEADYDAERADIEPELFSAATGNITTPIEPVIEPVIEPESAVAEPVANADRREEKNNLRHARDVIRQTVKAAGKAADLAGNLAAIEQAAQTAASYANLDFTAAQLAGLIDDLNRQMGPRRALLEALRGHHARLLTATKH